MAMTTHGVMWWMQSRLRRVPGMAFALGLPLLMLLGHHVWDEAGLYLAALLAPLAVWMARTGVDAVADPTTGDAVAHGRSGLEASSEAMVRGATARGHTTACLLLAIDEFERTRDRLGLRAAEEIHHQIGQRLDSALRRGDRLVEMNDGLFGVVLAPSARLDLEAVLQVAARLQRVSGDPILVAQAHIHVTLTVGFAQLTRAPAPTGAALVDAAEAALREAQRRGAGAVRAYSRELHRKHVARSQLAEDVEAALDLGCIAPYFQPQISTDTGRLTGFEALARWTHPEQGVIPPGEFLPAIEAAGLEERLGEVILHHVCTALCAWDRAALDVPAVGVNFTLSELRAPRLVDRIAWELDRFNLPPQRVTVEVLETVIAHGGEDIVSRNITGLAALGCAVDLDDFGTGHASITNIRRFPVSRVKIDRSFVQRIHESREQQRLVSAIITMAERLDLDTLAEGVEIEREHAMLAQLGCRHVQGFGIAKPMPLSDTFDWLRAYNSNLVPPPVIGRSHG